MHTNDIVLTELNEIRRFKFDTDNKGFNEFFHEFLGELEFLEFYAIKFYVESGMEDYEAYFRLHGGIGILAIPIKYYDTRLNDKALALILHEIGHFKHLMQANGEFMAPRLSDNDPVQYEDYTYSLQKRFNIEYEAYFRSLFYDKIYNMGLRDIIIKENTNNLLHVLNDNGLTIKHYNRDEFKIIESNVKPKDLFYVGEKLDLSKFLTNKQGE